MYSTSIYTNNKLRSVLDTYEMAKTDDITRRAVFSIYKYHTNNCR